MPRASRAKVAKVAQEAPSQPASIPSDPSDDDVPAVNLLKKPPKCTQSKNPKPIQPIMNNLHEVLRELEERRAKPKDLNELKLDETISKLKALRTKAQDIFGTCLSDLEDLSWSLD